jgi:hopanoid C-2 methylase
MMRTGVEVRHRRRILCVFPRYAHSFGTFQHAYPLLDGVKAFMPPQGLLAVAAYLPAAWEARLVDENIRPVRDEEFAWADAVFVSGMHVQRERIANLARRAHQHGRIAVLGGPSVSACPEYYPEFDYLHLGELGDATDALIRALDADIARPSSQIVLATDGRLPLADYPLPAYGLLAARRYFLGSIQASSGCPYQCEFCDIPALYGRQPRLKTPQQITAELDAMLAAGIRGAVYFVDDNFIANKKAARALLPHLIAWQKARGYPLMFSCEATLNIAQCPDILEMMREAYFYAVFCGIETPELGALDAIRKSHNHTMPLLDAVAEINRHGIEVVSGIILGLDTDTPASGTNLIDFIDRSHIPMLTINLLQALPKTPLWERLQAERRLVDDPGRDSNVAFRRPYADVLADWRRAIAHAYAPEAITERLVWNRRHTYRNRLRLPPTRARLSPANLRRGFVALGKILWRIGIRGDYRRCFWRMVWPALRTGRIDEVIGMSLVAHHMIVFTRDCLAGQETAAFYAERQKLPAGEPAVSA